MIKFNYSTDIKDISIWKEILLQVLKKPSYKVIKRNKKSLELLNKMYKPI